MTPQNREEYQRRKLMYELSDASAKVKEKALYDLDVEFGLIDKKSLDLGSLMAEHGDISDINQN